MKVVLAYSGGLDTSVIVKWIKDRFNAEVVTFAANVGQGEELEGLAEKAKATGASAHYTGTAQSMSLSSMPPISLAGRERLSNKILHTAKISLLVSPRGLPDTMR